MHIFKQCDKHYYFMALQKQFINFSFRACGREDIVETCAVNVEMVTDDLERKIASRHIMAEVTSLVRATELLYSFSHSF